MKKYTLNLIIFISFSSCSFGPPDDLRYKNDILPVLLEVKKNYIPQVFDGVLEPKNFPDLEKKDEILEGIDSNNDGIRDEIEIYINRTFKHDYERIVAKDYARWAYYYLKNFKKMNIEQLKAQQDKQDRFMFCSSYLESWGLDKSDEFRSFISGHLFDSYERVVAFNTMFQDSHKGFVRDLTPGIEVEVKYCPKEIIEKYPLKKLLELKAKKN